MYSDLVSGKYNIKLHSEPGADQNEERFSLDDMIVQVGLHNYDFIYNHPGLYDQLLYGELECQSPRIVVDKLVSCLRKSGLSTTNLSTLDIGSGPGNVGEILDKAKFKWIENLDINPLAKLECERQRPETYDAYHVADLCNPIELLNEVGANIYPQAHPTYDCLTMVAALSHDHIPVRGIRNAIKMLAPDGWVATCIGENVLDSGGELAKLMWEFIGGINFKLHHFERYRHRFAVDGRELMYYCIITRRVL